MHTSSCVEVLSGSVFLSAGTGKNQHPGSHKGLIGTTLTQNIVAKIMHACHILAADILLKNVRRVQHILLMDVITI
jgi:hypothetical protein